MSEEIGYRRPPDATRFRKGASGNPKGRPKGRRNALPHDDALGQMMTIRDEHGERRVTAAEGFMLHLVKQALSGQGRASPVTRDMLALVSETLLAPRPEHIDAIEFLEVEPGNPNVALIALRMAQKLDRFRPSARTALEPWIMQRALDRLSDRRFTAEEQRTIVAATRKP